MQLKKIMFLAAIVLLMGASSAASAVSFNRQTSGAAQSKPSASDPVAGKYEGVAKSQALGDIPLTVEIKNDGGKLSGKIETPQGVADITSGTYADGKITLKFTAGGSEGSVTAQMKDDKITGEWEMAGQAMGAIELKKMGATPAAPAKPDTAKTDAAKPMAADPVSGVWEASADAQGQPVLFTLTLKLEGEKVTGKSGSPQMGEVTISKGTWAGEKLSITLDTPGGAIVLTGTIKEGKIVGEFDFASQFQGKWEAKKK